MMTGKPIRWEPKVCSKKYSGLPGLAKQRKKKFGLYYRAPRFIRCWLWFIYNYIFRLGFLDGKEGFIYLYFECMWYRMLVDAKIYEQEKTNAPMDALKALD